MHQLVETELRKITTEFLKIDVSENSFLQKSIIKHKLIMNSIMGLENLIETKAFKTIDTEIEYYKVLKPQISQYLIYYENIIRIEKNFPIGSKKVLKKYLPKEQKSLTNFFNSNRQLFSYIRCKQTYADHIYFAKQSLYKDIVAAIRATDMLQNYLLEKEKNLPYLSLPNTSITSIQKFPNTNLKWTDPITGLVELVYAIWAKGSVNEGKATLKSLIDFFEILFSVSLSEYRRLFQDIKNRHKPDKFLNQLSVALTNKVDASIA